MYITNEHWSWKDIKDQRFGRLIVLGFLLNKKWECLCDCGNVVQIKAKTLNNGHTQSCGCLQKEFAGNLKRTHGMTLTSIYKTWRGIKGRCLNKNHHAFVHYGGRGITICDEWKKSFENFYRDMGEKPSKNHSIERIDNEIGYCKSNCKWILKNKQNFNKRNNIILKFDNQEKSLGEWCKELNLPYRVIHNRIYKLKWEVEKAFEYE